MVNLSERADFVPPETDLVGSVKPYRHHLAICTGGPPELWAARVEEMEGLFSQLNEALLARRLNREVKVTACDAVSLSNEGFDALLMPEMVRLPGLTPEHVAPLVSALETRFRSGFPFEVAPMPGGDHLFVCVHEARDERCGAWGPPLVAALEREIEAQGAVASVYRTSHVGGHKYAATCIIYPQGLWYGNLRPHDAPTLVQKQLNEEQLLPQFYRGRLGLSFGAQVVEGAAASHLAQRFGRFEGLSVDVREAFRDGWATGRASALIPTDEGWQPHSLLVNLELERGRWQLVTVEEE